ncbi:MAG: hypothetical protein AMJ65_10340 [Phycisphaerae bacterium SG8_4]|nr:MAG: hypothetical protein AMJ65_10340 [Phycisphaerae bacterium SG8_4]
MFPSLSETTATLSGADARIGKDVSAKLLCVAFLATALSASGSAREPWRFIVACDSRGGADGIEKTVLRELVTEISTSDVDFVLFPGDLVSGYSAGEPAQFESQLRVWLEIVKPLYDDDIGVYVCRGNHEVVDSWGADGGSNLDPDDNFTTRWLDVFGNHLYPEHVLVDNGPLGERHMTYSVTHKNALVILLDQYGGIEHNAVHKINQQWLDDQLATNANQHIFIAGHEPAFRALHSDCLDNNPSERDAFWASIRDAGGRTYFCGHDHFYDHARVDDGDGDPNNDIHQYIVGTAGAPPYSWSPPYSGNNTHHTVEQLHHTEGYGYILVEVGGPDAVLTWMQRNSNDLTVQSAYEPREVWNYTVTAELTVLAPNGGERLLAANPYTIKWKTRGADVQSVMIDYYDASSQGWQHIAQWPNTGWYVWDPVPTLDSAECLIRISAVQDVGISDTSDAAFMIFECRKKMPADLNGDCYVDFLDIAILAGDWLNCGNPFDASCD